MLLRRYGLYGSFMWSIHSAGQSWDTVSGMGGRVCRLTQSLHARVLGEISPQHVTCFDSEAHSTFHAMPMPVLAIVVHNTKVHGGIPPLHGRPGIQLKTFKHCQHPLYGVALVGRRERGTSRLVWFEQSSDMFSKFCWGLNAEWNGAFQSGPKSNIEWNGVLGLGHLGFKPRF